MLLTPQEWSALLLSLQVAAWCVAVVLVPGVALGWLLARRQFWGKTLLDAVVHLPLVLPPVVVGYGLLLLFGQRGLGRVLEPMGISVAFALPGAVLASAIMGLPLLVRSVRLAMELADVRLEQAARTLGARPLRVFATVTLPLAAPGVLTGAVLAFARSLGEFGATITVAGNIAGHTQTLPLAIYQAAQVPGGSAAASRLAIISVLLSLTALLCSELMARSVKRELRR